MLAFYPELKEYYPADRTQPTDAEVAVGHLLLAANIKFQRTVINEELPEDAMNQLIKDCLNADPLGLADLLRERGIDENKVGFMAVCIRSRIDNHKPAAVLGEWFE